MRDTLKNNATLTEIIKTMETMQPGNELHMQVGVMLTILKAIRKEISDAQNNL